MPSPRRSLPEDAAALLNDVQARALRVIVWGILAYCPFQIWRWHFPASGARSWMSFIFEFVLVVGAGAQFFALSRWSIRSRGILLTAWLGAIAILAWIASGPRMGAGITVVCTVLVAVFFVGPRAGALVVAGFALTVLTHAALAAEGLARLPASGSTFRSAGALLRATFPSFVALAVCYAGMAMIHRALFRALAAMEEERRNRDAAELGRRRAEETMRANQHFEAMGKLTSGVAHDVNNALTAVFCHAEMLTHELQGEPLTRARDILSAARTAAQTTRQLLTLNRRAFCEPVNTDPAAIAETVSRLVGRLMPASIRLRVEAGTHRKIFVDPADLQQALLNLLLNSRDAMPEGGDITLQVQETASAAGAPDVVVSVIDTGRGIPPEVRPRIFDPFFTTKPVGRGTGLGLSMVKAFVEEAGGSIAVESAPGRGTRLTLSFPESRVPDGRAEAAAASGVAGPGQTILLVEDEGGLRALMERSLVRGGYRVTAAASSGEALTLLDAGGEFDLLCTDGLTGATPIAHLIARFRRALPAAPVLLCSGHIEEELAHGGLATIRAELLRKPFTGTELLARVRGVLQAKDAPAG